MLSNNLRLGILENKHILRNVLKYFDIKANAEPLTQNVVFESSIRKFNKQITSETFHRKASFT